MSPYEAFVDNIGRVGFFNTKVAAVRTVRETIQKSARADNHGYVMDRNGEIVFEVGRNRED